MTMVFTDFKNTIVTITSNNHIKQKNQGQEYDTAYIKGEILFPAYTR